MPISSENIPLMCILVEDENNGFTAFFSQWPNIIAEGDTKEEATKNLIDTVQTVFLHQNNIAKEKYGDAVTTLPFNLNLAVAS